MNKLIDGKMVSERIFEDVKKRVSALPVAPKMVVVMVGANPASVVYVGHKEKACKRMGIVFEQRNFPETITTEELIQSVQEMNMDEGVNGMIIQMPLPAHVDAPKVFKAIDPQKDVDGFTAYNLGKMFLSTEFENLVPCTPKGIVKLLEAYEVPIMGSEVVIVGSSNIVGKPLAVMLTNRRATVTVCNSKTPDLALHTRRADILCVATGKPKMITADMVKEGVVVIDVGINRLPDGKLCGDTDFDAIQPKARLITPVPGGVGPMTVACLMDNLVRACERKV